MGCSGKVEKRVQKPVDERLNWLIQDFEKKDISLGVERYSKKVSKIHQMQRIYVILSYTLGWCFRSFPLNFILILQNRY